MIRQVVALLAQVQLPSVEHRMVAALLALLVVGAIVLGCDIGEYLMYTGVLPTNEPILITNDNRGNDGWLDTADSGGTTGCGRHMVLRPQGQTGQRSGSTGEQHTADRRGIHGVEVVC